MTLYAVLIFAEDSIHAPDATNDELREADDHFESMVATGMLDSAYALTPRQYARTVRADGSRDGPHNLDGEVVAGFYILKAESLADATALARKDPALRAGAGVEIRPVHSGGQVASLQPEPRDHRDAPTHAARSEGAGYG